MAGPQAGPGCEGSGEGRLKTVTVRLAPPARREAGQAPAGTWIWTRSKGLGRAYLVSDEEDGAPRLMVGSRILTGPQASSPARTFCPGGAAAVEEALGVVDGGSGFVLGVVVVVKAIFEEEEEEEGLDWVELIVRGWVALGVEVCVSVADLLVSGWTETPIGRMLDVARLDVGDWAAVDERELFSEAVSVYVDAMMVKFEREVNGEVSFQLEDVLEFGGPASTTLVVLSPKSGYDVIASVICSVLVFADRIEVVLIKSRVVVWFVLSSAVSF
jgi:hypothetical protein